MPYKDPAKAKEANRKSCKRWRENHPDRWAAYMRRWREHNPERAKELRIKSTHTERHRAKRRANWAKNREKHKEQMRSRQAKINAAAVKRYRTDVKFRVRKQLSNRLRSAIKNGQKRGRTMELLGCSADFLMGYLAGKFEAGMSWDNWGKGGWEIDHIKPLAKFDLTDNTQLAIACHYTNLQPLWKIDNQRKGARK